MLSKFCSWQLLSSSTLEGPEFVNLYQKIESMASRALGPLSRQLLRLGSTGATHSSIFSCASSNVHAFSTAAVAERTRERRFVRLSGVTSYAGAEDVKLFLKRNEVELPDPETSTEPLISVLKQGTADVFQNVSIWVYDAGSAESAVDAASKLNGRVAGMKLVRAAAVDLRVVSDLIGEAPRHRRRSLRRHLFVIAPAPEEYGRTVIVTNIPPNTNPRSLWGFFGTYDVTDVRFLRRSGVASVVMRTSEEAMRAIRERNNISLQGRGQVTVKMFY